MVTSLMYTLSMVVIHDCTPAIPQNFKYFSVTLWQKIRLFFLRQSGLEVKFFSQCMWKIYMLNRRRGFNTFLNQCNECSKVKFYHQFRRKMHISAYIRLKNKFFINACWKIHFSVHMVWKFNFSINVGGKNTRFNRRRGFDYIF